MSSVSSLNSLLSSTTSSSSSSVDLSSVLAAATGATSTGIDVTAAVAAAVYAAQAPERQWQAQQATIQSQITALTSIQTAAGSVVTDLQNLSDPLGSLTSRTVSSSNSSAVTATATAGTNTGTHTVQVNSIASAASWYSPVVASTTSALGSSALTITQASGTSATFSLAASGSNTLSSLVTSINAAKLGVTASIVQDASGARLALVGSDTGSSANFTVTDASSSASTWSSADLAPSTALLAGTFQVGDGQSSLAINVSAGSTLADVANQINAQGSDVVASVVTDSSGQHLNIASNSGANVTVSSDPTLVLTQAASAKNASLLVDGIPVSSASNTVSSAIPGITLNLTAPTQGSLVTLNVSPDTDSISSAVSKFVSDYNSTINLVSSQFQFSSTSGSQGVLGGDTVLRNLQSTLLGVGSFSATTSSTRTGMTLADLGVTMNDDGTLSLDSDALEQVVGSNPATVQNFFQGSSGADGFASTFKSQIDAFSNASIGTFATELSSLTQQYNELQSDVNNYESGYVASQKTLLTSMYSKAEVALQALPTTLKQLQTELGDNSGS